MLKEGSFPVIVYTAGFKESPVTLKVLPKSLLIKKITSLRATLKEFANKGRGVPGCVYNSTAVLSDKR